VITRVAGTNTTGHGLYISGSSRCVEVASNKIFNNSYTGIHVNGDISDGAPGIVSYLHLVGNAIVDNGQNGINADGIQDSLIENNLIARSQRNGIELYQIDAYSGSARNAIVHNTIVQRGGHAIEVAPCRYDNQSVAPTPPGCERDDGDTSVDNVAVDNILIGAAAPTNVVSERDLQQRSNLTNERDVALSARFEPIDRSSCRGAVGVTWP
jgi:hypothetical protein